MEPPSNGYSNTPPGYPQQSQQPGYQQQYPQPGYGGPGMAPPPYPQYAPPKKGMPWWGWMLILGCGGFALLFIVGILALASIPLITANTRDARRAEGEQMLGSLKNQARVAFAKLGVAPTNFTAPISETTLGCNVHAQELTGVYYEVDDNIASSGRGASGGATITATPTGPQGVASDGVGRMEFQWGGGDGHVTWR